ncbi:hypothetical protein M9Y10_033961 [Tritrichomonas musculus]|uniref:DUF3447 domain-containing protein n=1 Tax=Tritrichomonas musculus TaxID=1915356 RepID=A0ABR2KDK0_9EUKA
MSLKGDINTSIYDTNTFLLGKNITLIQYAAFFGATQIFKYLFMNGAELRVSLWNFAVHSDNSEIIHFIEENKDKIKEKSFFSIQVAQITQNNYIDFLKESIKCHHNDVANYILNNFLEKERSSLDHQYPFYYYYSSRIIHLMPNIH